MVGALLRMRGFARLAFGDGLKQEVEEFVTTPACWASPPPALDQDLQHALMTGEIPSEEIWQKPTSERMRRLLQQWGTEYRRDVNPYYWVDKLAKVETRCAGQSMLKENVLEVLEEVEALVLPEYEHALIGLGTRGAETVAVYDSGKLVQQLIDEGMDEDDAAEHFEFNIASAWVGNSGPMFVHLIDPEESEA